MLQNIPSKIHFYEKIKMLKKKPHLWLSPLSLLARLTMIAPKEKAEKNSTITNFQFFCNLQKHHNAHNNIPKKIFVTSLRKN
jgi:hypothetical protein